MEQTSKSVLCTLWYLLTLHFGLRLCQEHNNMFLEDFILNKDDQGTEYVPIQIKPNKDQAMRFKRKTKSHPAKNICHLSSPLSSSVLQNIFCAQTETFVIASQTFHSSYWCSAWFSITSKYTTMLMH